jgi:hypothetical protein
MLGGGEGITGRDSNDQRRAITYLQSTSKVAGLGCSPAQSTSTVKGKSSVGLVGLPHTSCTRT